MTEEAPYSYVEWYYDNDWRLRNEYPQHTDFIDRFVGMVDGDVVLNAGCGPQFYDLLARFARVPTRYVGVDRSRETTRFLRESTNRQFLECRNAAITSGASLEPVCADIFDWPGLQPNHFDAIVAIGFIGTFHGDRLKKLLDRLHGTLKRRGRLVKLTWHGPHRTPEQTVKKLEYGYDSLEEHDPELFIDTIKAAGFSLLEHDLSHCDPESYRWDVIQAAVFEKQS